MRVEEHRRPGRCFAAPLGKGRGLEKLPPRAERRRGGGLDEVPPPCWEDLHEQKRKQKLATATQVLVLKYTKT